MKLLIPDRQEYRSGLSRRQEVDAGTGDVDGVGVKDGRGASATCETKEPKGKDQDSANTHLLGPWRFAATVREEDAKPGDLERKGSTNSDGREVYGMEGESRGSVKFCVGDGGCDRHGCGDCTAGSKGGVVSEGAGSIGWKS